VRDGKRLKGLRDWTRHGRLMARHATAAAGSGICQAVTDGAGMRRVRRACWEASRRRLLPVSLMSEMTRHCRKTGTFEAEA
jgi:hypothetical protein